MSVEEFIQRIVLMKEKEKKHLDMLIVNHAPIEMIKISKKHYNHFKQRIKEYQEYNNKN